MKHAFLSLTNSFRAIFNFQNDESKGRIIALSSTLLTTVYNVFVAGIFYTGFLTMYGMSITDTGILSVMPFIATLASVFSPKILSRFKRRKTILLCSRVIYYLLYIVLTTIMPQFVHEPRARLMWFIVIITVSTVFYSLFSNGFSAWLYNFYPADNNTRQRYLTISQICASILSSIVLIGSGLLTDALSDSPLQDQLILIFRYFAFGLVLVEVFLLAKAKEYPYLDSEQLRLSEVFTLPFKYKKSLFCMSLYFAWCFMAYLNGNGTWSYHLLNHLEVSYSLINTISVLYTLCLLLLSPVWSRTLRRFSWIKTAGIAVLIFAPSELVAFFLTKNSLYLYIPVGIYQNIASVGINLAFANLIYMNLPKENSTVHLTFYTVGANLFAFLGSLCGTWISSITGDNYIMLMGIEVYSIQYTTLIRFVLLTAFGLIMLLKWRIFTSDEEIERVGQVQQALAHTQKPSLQQQIAYLMYRLQSRRKR